MNPEAALPAAQRPLRDLLFVHIIESPKPEDLLVGRTEGGVLSQALRLAGIEQSYNLAVNEGTFHEALSTRCIDAIQKLGSRIPILHLSMHGNKSGVALTDGTLLDWNRLSGLLVPMNKALQGNLVVAMSTCFGSFGSMMAMSEGGELPFMALVGSSGTATWDEAAVAFVTFYHQLFRGAGIDPSVAAMKVASGHNQFASRFGVQVQKDWVEYVRRERAADLARRIQELSPPASGPNPGRAGA